MHKMFEKQLSIMEPAPAHPKVQEYEAMSHILDRNRTIYELALQDLTKNVKTFETGANGMTAEQVVRAAVIKQSEGYSYHALAFHIADSNTFRNFCMIGIQSKEFKKSTLQQNIKAISPETWEAINRILKEYAEKQGIEKGRKVRLDCTVVSSDIHDPTDSSLLGDVVRVFNRIMGKARSKLDGLSFPYQDHTRRAKRRVLGVLNAKNKKIRKAAYNDLLKVTGKTLGYAQAAIKELKHYTSWNLQDQAFAYGAAEELAHYMPLALNVMDQTERRVLHGETVPASEKVVSIFEPHTDIIKKDNRDTHYGHKICLTGGASNLILDCVILKGNPADSTLTGMMLDRQKKIYGKYPLKAALDGGFASKANLESAKAMGVKDVCFSKGRGLEEEDMCRSSYVYRRLRNFRAGIESGISWLKRSFGLGRCLWKGFTAFKSYVWSSIVSANLLTLARNAIA